MKSIFEYIKDDCENTVRTMNMINDLQSYDMVSRSYNNLFMTSNTNCRQLCDGLWIITGSPLYPNNTHECSTVETLYRITGGNDMCILKWIDLFKLCCFNYTFTPLVSTGGKLKPGIVDCIRKLYKGEDFIVVCHSMWLEDGATKNDPDNGKAISDSR